MIWWLEDCKDKEQRQQQLVVSYARLIPIIVAVVGVNGALVNCNYIWIHDRLYSQTFNFTLGADLQTQTVRLVSGSRSLKLKNGPPLARTQLRC